MAELRGRNSVDFAPRLKITEPKARIQSNGQASLAALLLIFGLLLSPSVQAQDSLRAAAVVNDEVISILDVIMRIRLAIVGSGVEDSPEARDRIGRQVLNRLIDERLQLQEAARLEIDVPEEQVEQALGVLADQNSMSRDDFMSALQRSRILPSVLLEQIRAELAWRAIVQIRLMPSVVVSEEEVDAVAQRITSRDTGKAYRVAEILLSVENPSQEEAVRQRAESVVAQARSGANFAGLARQFSSASSANLGGDLGWVPSGGLPDQLDQVIKALQPNQISNPLRTLTGFTILLLRETRDREDDGVDRAAIEQDLLQRRVQLLAQRSLQDLRRIANIDIRI